jgi:malate synthase
MFDKYMPTPNQLDKLRQDVTVGQKEMLEVHDGTRSETGMRENIRVGVQYIEAWLRGRGAVPLYNLMEDAATAEISRSQIWQQLHLGAKLDDGRPVTKELFETCLVEEMERVKGEIGEKNYAAGRFPESIDLFRTMSTADRLDPFLTLPAYRLIV